MFFVGTNLITFGYTMLYAAIKGDSYTVGGVPVWRRPWLPFVDVFTGRAISKGQGAQVQNRAPGADLAAAVSVAQGQVVTA